MARRAVLALVTALTLSCATAHAEEAPGTATVNLECRDAELGPVLASIARAGGYGVVVASEPPARVSVSLHEAPWSQALLGVLRVRGLHAYRHGKVLAITARAPRPDDDELAAPTSPRRKRPPAPEAPGELIDVVVDDSSLDDVADEIARQAGKTVVVDPALAGAKVTIELRKVGVDEALAAVAKACGAGVRSRGDLVAIDRVGRVSVAGSGLVRDVLTTLSGQSGENVVVGPDVRDRCFVDTRDLPGPDAIEAVVDACGLWSARVGTEDGVLCVAARQPVGRLPASHGTSWIDEVATDELTRGPGPVDLSVEGADARDVAGEIRKRSGFPLFAAPDLVESVTLTARQLTGRQLARVLARKARGKLRRLPGDLWLLDQPTRVSVSFTDDDSRAILALIGVYAAQNLAIAPDVTGAVTLDLHGADWFATLEALALVCGLHLSEVQTGTIAISGVVLGPPLDEPPDPVAAWRHSEAVARAVTLDVTDADLGDVCATIGAAMDRKLIVEPEAHALVTLAVKDLDGRDALGLVARLTGCRIETRGAAVVISRPPFITCQATRVSAASWLEVLRRSFGVQVESRGEGTLTLDLHDLTPPDLVRASAVILGCPVTELPDGAFVLGARTIAPAPGATPRPPARAPVPAPEDPAKAREAAQQLDRALDSLLGEVQGLARGGRPGDLLARCGAIRPLVGASGAARARAALARWSDRLAPWPEIALALELQISVQESDACLARLDRAMRRERWDDVRVIHRELGRILAIMRAHERVEFRRHADAARVRGEAIAALAAARERIARDFAAECAAIVVDRRPGRRSLTVLEFQGVERIYGTNDALRDAKGAETPVRIVEISEHTIRLRLDTTDFIRELRPE